jgi:3-oxo-5-alpha-steroid 4-dehydrogenase 3
MDDVAALARVSIAAFWLLFAAASLVADRDWAPWASSRLRAFAARGKNGAEDDPRAWTVPHAWFTHFYVVGTCWNAIVALHALRAASRLATPPADDAALASTLFQIHVARRLLESILVTRHRPGARMHVMGYLIGVLYYLIAPLTLAGTPAVAALVESVDAATTTTPGASFAPLSGEAATATIVILRRYARAAKNTGAFPSPSWWASSATVRIARVSVGAAAWALGNARQNEHHRALADLRRTNKSAEKGAEKGAERGAESTGARRGAGGVPRRRTVAGETRDARRTSPDPNAGRDAGAGRYGIPVGGWFDRVVCPHYAAEVLLYAGLCAVAGKEGARVNLAMLAAVFGNLALAARRQREWYEANVPGYPRGRWAMIPGVA